jgi:hypothetical protein
MHSDLDRGGTLQRLLRALPEDTQPPYDFREFQRRAAARTDGARGQLLATAAALAALAAVLLLRLGTAPVPWMAGEDLTAPESGAPTAGANPEAMDRWLAALPDDPPLVRVGSRAAVTGLEDRIAQLDDLLSTVRLERGQRARLDALQQERTRLVGSLIQVRYAETLADAAQ